MSNKMLRGLAFIRRMSTDPLLVSEKQNKLIGPSLQHWFYKHSRFNQYGLMRDDMLHETPVVQEALKRLPQHIIDERTFRIVRAGYLCLRKEVLPKEQWMKLEDDVLYLQPIIKEVEKELAEKREWEKE